MRIGGITITSELSVNARATSFRVLERLREITATDEEFRTEARSLLGVDVK